MAEHVSPIIQLFGLQIDLAALIMIVVTSVVVLILAISGSRNASVNNPSKIQNFMEWVIEFVQGILGSTFGSKHGKPFLTLGLTLIMFIFIGNMLGLPFSFVTEHKDAASATIAGQQFISNEVFEEAAKKGHHEVGVSWWKSPTADVAVTGALALLVIFLSHYLGITRNTKHYFKHYFEPNPLMFPLHLVEVVSKPLTLALRLYGNIYAGEVMISVIIGAGYFGIIPLFVWQGFSVFVGAIQAFIFTMLTMVYISQAMVHEEEGH
ncbi:F0F1 ATP synthase subunit A [Paenibacillus allorhizosphaerae]|uniref:ATP synthase subunit a n=1 Tax=Paenibacillus allorhizosphaerae TaxID=2849866 RepID=A0ABN7TTX2_9BACL|nr:F0F1 ATP synthase subunit A [Paenibacillus allorhizosphaerae]CAG7655620.1 ATP synthase subunit a [Paenibacillus allorhizosphaerae]